MEKVKLKTSFSSKNRREINENALFYAFFHLKARFIRVFTSLFPKNQVNKFKLLTV